MPDEPVGSVVAFAGEIVDNGGVVEVPSAGSGWLLCNGAAVRSSQFPQLFAAIRAAHGNGSDDANPATDFNLPDFRGLFLRGVSGTSGRDPDATDAKRPRNHPGGNVGNRVGSTQADEVGRHTHGVNDPQHSHGFAAFRTNGAGAVGQAFPNNSNPFSTDRAATGITIQNSTGSESRPKNAYVHWIIKARP